MKRLTTDQIRYLRAQAHHLKPVVHIGENGLSEAVLKEIASTIRAHELIKIKVMHDDRLARNAISGAICAHIGAAAVQHIGKTLLIYKAAEQPKLRLPN